MPLTIDSTISYATLDQATAYFAWRFVTDAWDSASNDDRCRALVTATRAIDRLNFSGLRTSDWVARSTGYNIPLIVSPLAPSAPPGQPLEFPRNGATDVPVDIQNACCEIAYALLDGVDPEAELQGIGITSRKFAEVSSNVDLIQGRQALRHGIPSQLAWTWLVPYLADPHSILVRRVN